MRVATTDQLADIVFGQEQPATAYRLARRHLLRLIHAGLVERYSNTARPRRPGPPGYVHALTPAGHALLGRSNSRQRRSWHPSPTTLAHWLAIPRLYTRLITASRSGGAIVREFHAEGDAMRQYRDGFGRLHLLRPDVLVRLLTGGLELSWFVEIDLATEGLTALAAKCRSYRDYERSGIEQRFYGLFPGVMFIVPSPARAQAVQRVVDRQPADARGLFFVTTEDEAPHALATAL